MATTGVKVCGIISLFVVLLALLYRKENDDILRNQMDEVLSGLLRAEKKVSPAEVKVAVGFGSCMDVIADALNLFDIFPLEPPLEPEHFNEVGNKEHLEKLFAYFYRHGAAAERYVSNSTFFEELVTKAWQDSGTRKAVGGNAPVMANRFHMEGFKVLLASTVSDDLLSQISPEVQVVGGKLEKDDVHLLLEYRKDSQWGPYTAPRANRLIVHNDDNNPHIKSLSGFIESLHEFSPSLVVVSGLQMLDNFPFKTGQRANLLEELRDVLTSIPDTTRMHFEMASFAEEDCLTDVIDNIVYYVDSLGMNEQELPNLHSILTNGSVTLISDPYPRIATTLDQMRAVYDILRATPEKVGKRKLTRLHVHTLAYQAILTTKGSPWKNTMSAAAKASLTANRHVCASNQIKTEKARILMDDSFTTSRNKDGRRIPFDTNRPVSCWDEDDFEICIAPVLVCTDVVQTGGGGDNISSAGLVLQI